MLPPMFVAFVAEMFLGVGSLKTVASSRCSVTVLWNFCLRIFNKGFYPQSKSLLSGMLCRNLLFKSGVTVETIEK